MTSRRYASLLLLLALPAATLAFLQTGGATHHLQEYCEWETFNASCPSNHVVLMTSAHYGRMKLGRCLTADYYVGCSAHVLAHMDFRCSGKRNCTINIPDKAMDRAQPCRKDLGAYLEASFICVPVSVPPQPCLGGVRTHLQAPSGYLTTGTHTGVTPPDVIQRFGGGCVWLITTQPGQKINVTLLDFAPSGVEGGGPQLQKTYRRRCATDRVSVTERDVTVDQHHSNRGDVTRNLSLCTTGEARERHLFLSSSHALQLRIHSSAVSRFLIHYHVVGCPDLKAPPHGWVQRLGETAIVRCNHTFDKWHLVCKDTTWVGELHNCSAAQQSHVTRNGRPTNLRFPHGLFIAVSIGVVLGSVFGIVLLFAVLVCRKRLRSRNRNGVLNIERPRTADQGKIYTLIQMRPDAVSEPSQDQESPSSALLRKAQSDHIHSHYDCPVHTRLLTLPSSPHVHHNLQRRLDLKGDLGYGFDLIHSCQDNDVTTCSSSQPPDRYATTGRATLSTFQTGKRVPPVSPPPGGGSLNNNNSSPVEPSGGDSTICESQQQE